MAQTYEQKKRTEAERQRRKTRSGQDIAPLPPVADPARRAEALSSFQRFNEIYFPHRFGLQWSPDHLQVNSRMEEVAKHGGLYALAMPRGSGKTSLCETLCIFAAVQGLHDFIMLLPTSATRAKELLDSIKTELLSNDALADDFPEVCHAIRSLEDRANRAKGQHLDGEPTHISWGQNQIVLPAVRLADGSWAKSSGVVIRVAGIISGGVRGAKYVRHHDGRTVRPSLAILDDPQTDEVARSPYQVEKRHRLIHGAVLGMAGPGKRVAAICPCTVICKGDLADRLLDRSQSPLWTGQRYKLLYRFPERKDLWQEYADRRNDELRNGGDGSLATAWYGQRRDEMDKGALAAWPERFQPDELSAIQHAMNLYFRDASAFASEYQNDPLPEVTEAGQLVAADVAARINGRKRGLVPLEATRLTCYADVQQSCLFYVVAGWSDSFAGYVVDYGTYPDQHRRHFTLKEVERTLAKAAPGTGLEGSIHAGLSALADGLLCREWKREDGAMLKIEKLVIDANWGPSTDCIYAWCRTTPHAALVMPAHGKYVGAKSKPWHEYEDRPGQRLGLHWLIPATAGKRFVRHLLIDVNWWKSFVRSRLQLPLGEPGALTLFGEAGTDHRLFAEHCCAEYFTPTEGKGRKLEEWSERPGKPDNHWWDALVGSAAAASVIGVVVPQAQEPSREGKRVKWSEQYAAKHGRKAS